MISHVCSTDRSKSKDYLAKKNLSHVCSIDEGEAESVIVDESSTEESKPG